MSLLSRISGLVDSFQTIELEARERYGAGGEDEVEAIISRNQWRYVRNPLAPHPSKPGLFLESDFLVHVNGGLFAVEVKRLNGRVVYDADHRFMLQEKRGRHAEGVFVKRFSNPLQKTNGFAYRLKCYLTDVDPRFRHVSIDAVAAFAPTADISAVHDRVGLIYTSELPDFLMQRSVVGDGRRVPWLDEALGQVPTWDRVETTLGEVIYGLFSQPTLDFGDASMKRSTIPFADIAEVRLQPGGLFSAASEASIRLVSGEVVQTRVGFGDIRLERFGALQVHKLRNLTRIVPGVARLRGRLAATGAVAGVGGVQPR
jgi:hypothetical protein